MDYKTPLKLNLKKGALHESLGVPQSKPIPEGTLASALGSTNPLLKKRAVFAKNAASWDHSK